MILEKNMGDEMIDKMLEEMEKSDLSKPNKKDLAETKKELELDAEDINSIAEELIRMTKDDRSKANKIYEMFFTSLGLERDKSEASKEALTKALELKIEASKNLIELLKIKTRNNEVKTNIGIVFPTLNQKKSGININRLKEETNR